MHALLLSIGWLLALILAVGSWFLMLKRARSRIPCCPFCGHDVRGLTGPRCVECGRSLEAGVVPIGGVSRRRRWGLVAVILLLAGALVYPAFAWGGQAMFGIARWRLETQPEVEIKVELVLETTAGERFSLFLRGVDHLDKADIVRITIRIEEPGQEPMVWEQAGLGTWNSPLGAPVDGGEIVADLTARLEGEPRGLITRALLEHPEDFATFLIMAAADPEGVSTTVRVPGRDTPLMRFNSSSFGAPGSRSVQLMPTSMYLLPQRIGLGVVVLALLLGAWVLLRPGLVPWSEFDGLPSDRA